MALRQAQRRNAKLRIGLFGSSGSGKTYSSLLMASGMAPWEKIVIVDTEQGSGELYSHLGPYNTITLSAPFTPEKYVAAIKECEKAGMQVIIIDSISHEWEGRGGCLELHDNMPGNSYTNWGKITPRHNSFIDAILQSPAHIIACGRSKQDYVLQEKNGKQVPEKVGLKVITREGFDYEMTLAFDLDIKNNAVASKDRTGLFKGKPDFVITPETGKSLLAWANSGVARVEAAVEPESSQPFPDEELPTITIEDETPPPPPPAPNPKVVKMKELLLRFDTPLKLGGATGEDFAYYAKELTGFEPVTINMDAIIGILEEKLRPAPVDTAPNTQVQSTEEVIDILGVHEIQSEAGKEMAKALKKHKPTA